MRVVTAPEIPTHGDRPGYGDHPGGLRFRRLGKGDEKWYLDEGWKPDLLDPFEIHWQEVSWPRNRELQDFELCDYGLKMASGKWRQHPMDAGGTLRYYLTLYPGGAHWNGVSGGGRDTAITLWASCVHDMLYRANREGLLLPEKRPQWERLYDAASRALRKAADQQMRRHLVQDARRFKPPLGGAWSRFRAGVIYKALRAFGDHAWNGRRPQALHPGERLISSRLGVL